MILKTLTLDNLLDFAVLTDEIGADDLIDAFFDASQKSAGKDTAEIGQEVIKLLLRLIIKKLPVHRHKIYEFIAGCVAADDGADLTAVDIQKLPVMEAFNVIKQVLGQDGFADFFKASGQSNKLE